MQSLTLAITLTSNRALHTFSWMAKLCVLRIVGLNLLSFVSDDKRMH